MEIIGYFAALFIGISLGLIGGGGSILTIPVLVYLFNIDPFISTGYSLFIVGFSSLVGAIIKYKQGEVDIRVAGYFGLSSIITVVLVRKLLLPIIPNHLFFIASFEVTKSIATLILFAMIMIVASIQMIRKDAYAKALENKPIHAGNALFRGVEVGILTGLIGAGGGFLIIPVLIFIFQLPMKKAIGTSLLIIAANSLFGFLGDLTNSHFIWPLLFKLTAISCIGILLGDMLSSKISGAKLKKGFGFFVLSVGCYMILHEVIKIK